MNEIEQLKEWVDESSRIVFFGGAGVSTESGIPDFRSVDGLYNQKYKYPPETIISRSFFYSNPAAFYEFYRDKLVIKNAKPNIVHYRLAEWEQQGKLSAVVTQNIDELHQAAGSKKVLELHGSTKRCYCERCRKAFPLAALEDSEGIPRCDCGGMIRPDIVLYEEPLDEQVLTDAVDCIRKADLLIIGGTSLVVYPAAGLINYYRGNHLVLVNLSETPQDYRADLVIHKKLGEVFSQL